MTPGLAWILAGLVLCGAELLLPGAFLLWIGVAAIAAGLVTHLAALAFLAQVAVFILLLALVLAASIAWRRGHRGPDVNAPGHDVIGRTCHAIAFDGNEGRVRFRDGTWAARIDHGTPPEPGASLRIVGLAGTTLIVSAERDAPN